MFSHGYTLVRQKTSIGCLNLTSSHRETSFVGKCNTMPYCHPVVHCWSQFAGFVLTPGDRLSLATVRPFQMFTVQM